jgi:hypothetical protein
MTKDRSSNSLCRVETMSEHLRVGRGPRVTPASRIGSIDHALTNKERTHGSDQEYRAWKHGGSDRLHGALVVLLIAAQAQLASGAVAHPNSRSADSALASRRAKIDMLIRRAIRAHDLQAVIVQATANGRPVIARAFGQSMTGAPATVRMYLRNGAVAISYMSTLLLRLVDQHKVKPDTPISRWLPRLRDSRPVTLRMLAGMTAGYPDYEADPRLAAELYADPFRHVTTPTSDSAIPNAGLASLPAAHGLKVCAKLSLVRIESTPRSSACSASLTSVCEDWPRDGASYSPLGILEVSVRRARDNVNSFKGRVNGDVLGETGPLRYTLLSLEGRYRLLIATISRHLGLCENIRSSPDVQCCKKVRCCSWSGGMSPSSSF